MKHRILVAFLFVFFVQLVHGQSLQINSKVINIDAVAADDDDKSGLTVIKNISTDMNDTMFNWKILSITSPSTWQIDFCDPLDCIPSTPVGFDKTFKLLNSMSGSLKTDVYFKGISGTGMLKVSIKSVLHPENIDTITFNVKATGTTGVKDAEKSKEIVFYPNPAKDVLNIKFNIQSRVEVNIYNILGSRVKTITCDAGTNEINIADLQKGVYFIRYTDKGKVVSKTFTKAD